MLAPGLSAEIRLKEDSQMSCTDKGGQGPFRGQDAPFAPEEYSAREWRVGGLQVRKLQVGEVAPSRFANIQAAGGRLN